MIMNKNIEIEITGYNLRTYIEKFPNIKKGDTIAVNQIEGLSLRSTVNVECLCSNEGCKNTYFRARRNIHTETTYCSDMCRGESTRRKNHQPRKDKILESIRQRIDNNESVRYWSIRNEDPKLLHAIDKYYPLNEIFRDLGISEDEAVNKYKLTRNISKKTLSKSEIVGRIKYLKSIGRLTTSAMRTEFNDNRLETSIKTVYGSVENCFQELGISRDVYHINTLIKMGNLFEQVFKNILIELRIDFLYGKTLENGYIPDFTLIDDNIIIDTKLSSWTSSIAMDIVKYSEYCDTLIFVYLREGTTLPKNSENVQYVNVQEYIKKLPADRKDYYNQELENILSYHP